MLFCYVLPSVGIFQEMLVSRKEGELSVYRDEIDQLKKQVSRLEVLLAEASTTEHNLKQKLEETKAKERLLVQKVCFAFIMCSNFSC